MSHIDKLAIQGIRSFDSRGHYESIRFYSPLTLVVGVNGSGKTTIIESLKYAVTGILPPGAKVGGAFIHDPALNGETKSFAQVKLAFTSTKKVPLVATRNLELTVKKTGRAMKTLEASLLLKRQGDEQSLSTRVVELDQILPRYLGASTAVIENVIFCHQEESLWPLGDSASLKKKFDEIFEADKYTKAIKTIHDIRKKKNIELGQMKIIEQNAKEDKDRASRAKIKSIRLQGEIETHRTEIEDLGRRMKKASELADQAHEDSEGYARILGQLEGKRIEAKSRRQNVEELRKDLTELTESDEWLESALARFDAEQRELQEMIEAKTAKWREHQAEAKTLRAQMDGKLALRGKFQQEKDEYNRQLSRRKTRVRDTAGKHGMRGFDDLSDDRLVDEFMFKIRKAQKEQQSTFGWKKREHNAEKEAARTSINKLTQQKEALQQSKISANRQTALNTRESNDYQKKADAIRVDEATKAITETRLEELKSNIKRTQAEAKSSLWGEKLQTSNSSLRELEDTGNQLNNELVQATRRAGETARLAHVKQELREKQRSLQTLVSAHEDRIKTILGQAFQAITVEHTYQDALEAATRELNTATREMTATQQELEQVDFKQKTARSELAKQNATVKQCEQKIRAVIDEDPPDFEQTLRDAERSAEAARGSGGGAKQLQDYFRGVLETMNNPTKPFCRTCKRAFKDVNDKSLAGAKQRVEDLIAKAVEQEAQSALQDREDDLNQLQALRSTYDIWKQTTESTIPSLNKTIDNLRQEHDSVNNRLEKRDAAVQEKEQIKKDLESISKTVANIGKIYADVQDLSKQSEELATKQSQHSSGRTIDDIQEAIVTNGDSVRKLKAEISRLTTDQESSRAELSEMNDSLHSLQSDLKSTGFELEKKASLLARVNEFKIQNQKQRELVEKADSEIERLEPEIATAKTKLEDITERADTNERELSRETSELTTSLQALELLNDQIQGYLNRGGDNQLANIDRDIENSEQEAQSLEAESAKFNKEGNKLAEKMREGTAIKRQYSDNLRYRQNSRAFEKLTIEIRDLDSHNAQVDRDRLRKDSEKFTKEHNTLSAKQAGLMGSMHENDKQLGELLTEFETDLKDAPKRYTNAHINTETTKAAVSDLAKYGGALDKAIMHYHSMKMNEINGIIDQLWKETYQGNDIDTLMIRADGDPTSGRKSHNYRVMMVKDFTEMDMRGRCSAGQKVLASIIIRLALAECFSSHCGVFALDEPTTNLDRDNIVALAKSLHGIIKARQQQENFQLLIITHDEEFLRNMQCGEFADHYYLVSRNSGFKSIIERQDIAQVM